jgi:WD40 repeat protein
MHRSMPKVTLRLCCCAVLATAALAAAQSPVQPNERTTGRPSLVVQRQTSGFGLSAIGVSADGHLVVTADKDNTATLWDVDTGMALRTLIGRTRSWSGHDFGVTSVAFSPEGKLLLTGCDDDTASLWDVETGEELHVLRGHSAGVTSVAFAPDGMTVLTGSEDKTARLWNVATGEPLHVFSGHTGKVSAVAFSPDGRSILTASEDGTARVWDVETGWKSLELRKNPDSESDWNPEDASFASVAFSPNGRWIATGGDDKTARLWDAKTGAQIRVFSGHKEGVTGVVFDPNGDVLLTVSYYDNSAKLWNIRTGEVLGTVTTGDYAIGGAFSTDGAGLFTGSTEEVELWDLQTSKQLTVFGAPGHPLRDISLSADGRRLAVVNTTVDFMAKHADLGSARYRMFLSLWDLETGQLIRHSAFAVPFGSDAALTPDGHMILAGSGEGAAKFWDADTGGDLRTVSVHSRQVNGIAFSPDGRTVLTGSFDQTAKLWNTQSGRVIRTLTETGTMGSVALAPDGHRAVTSSSEDKLAVWTLWNMDSGRVIRRVTSRTGGGDVFGFSPDGRWFLTGGNWDNTARLWDANTGKLLHVLSGHAAGVSSGAFSPDGRMVLTGSHDDTARLWDARSGRLIRTLSGLISPVLSVAFAPNGRNVLTASFDGTVKVWDVSSGREVCTLDSFEDGTWAVVDSEGRFDTNDLDGGGALHWVIPDEPMRPLPLEIFMRDYYTPRLLARILDGEKLPPVRSLAEIRNRVQPDVSVVSVALSKTISGRADVVVRAASHIDEKGQASGLRDLRLFRNGQLVGYREGELKDGDFAFTGVQLPATAKSVTFTAYAFNSERIKSATAEKEYSYQPGPAAKPRAWLLQIGVNHYEAAGCDLNGSANDAEALSKLLTERLTARGLEVRPTVLVSTDTVNDATKEKIHEALARIAAAATPDDVFFLSFSGHGYSNQSGQFYLLPADVRGSCTGVDEEMLRTAVSAEDLTEWLRPIDAGDMTFILDACDSASSVESNDFKPGPMGSAGLGQLAYDKRMRILAASQPNQAARESAALGQGLLSYALTELGLVEGEADWKPKDGKITVAEWLGFAADEVPKFVESGAVKGRRGLVPVGAPQTRVPSAQTPAVFDFSKQDTFILQ